MTAQQTANVLALRVVDLDVKRRHHFENRDRSVLARSYEARNSPSTSAELRRAFQPNS
jgi:hypothetical protein